MENLRDRKLQFATRVMNRTYLFPVLARLSFTAITLRITPYPVNPELVMEPHACVPKRTMACRHGKIPWYLTQYAYKGDIPIPG